MYSIVNKYGELCMNRLEVLNVNTLKGPKTPFSFFESHNSSKFPIGHSMFKTLEGCDIPINL